MSRFALVRAAYLLLYIDRLREIGAPVDGLLHRSKLPDNVEESPDAYVSLDFGLNWVGRSNRDVAPMDLSVLASEHLSFDTLSRPFRNALLAAPTGFNRLQVFMRLAPFEDSAVRPSLRREGDRVRVICGHDGFDGHPHLHYAECLNLHATIAVLRGVAGAAWSPEEVTFISKIGVTDRLRESMPATRIRMGRQHCSILFDPRTLAPGLAEGAPASAAVDVDDDWTWLTALRLAIRPYLGDPKTTLPFAAELMGTSPRSLQRRLRESGRTYSQVVQDARFEIARELLAETSVKMIDVAMMTGYENPQHFSRAFRRLSGMTPTTYRRSISSSV